MLPRGQALRSREGTGGPSAGPACPGQPRHRSAQHHALTSWSHGARARALHSSCHLSWCWHSSLHRRLHQRGSAVDVHATLPGRETRPQQSPVTQAHAAQLGKPVLAMPVTSSMVNASLRLLLWAEAGTMGYSGGSAGHSALALVPAQVLALAAGCLGSEEEHWSGDAGFSRSRRRKKGVFFHPLQQATTNILPAPEEAARDKPERSPGRRSSLPPGPAAGRKPAGGSAAACSWLPGGCSGRTTEDTHTQITALTRHDIGREGMGSCDRRC